jgi:hypothetical protein
MNSTIIYEIIGWTGSVLVIVSLMQRSIFKLRLIGLGAAGAFLVYGLLIGAYPIAIVNVVVIGVHLYFLRKLTVHPEEVFSTLEVYPESRYLAYFLEFYADEISQFQPEFSYDPGGDHWASFLLRGHVPAGLVIARPCQDGSLAIELDFVTPEYRDFKLGEFLYSEASGLFTDLDCTQAWSPPGSSDHARYLERVGFQLTSGPNGEARYEFSLESLREPVT